MHKYKNNFEGLNKFIFFFRNDMQTEPRSDADRGSTPEIRDTNPEATETSDTTQQELYQETREAGQTFRNRSIQPLLNNATNLKTIAEQQIRLPDGSNANLITYAIDNQLLSIENYSFLLGLLNIPSSVYSTEQLPINIYNNLRATAQTALENFESQYGRASEPLDYGRGNNLISANSNRLSTEEVAELQEIHNKFQTINNYHNLTRSNLGHFEEGLQRAQELIATETQIANQNNEAIIAEQDRADYLEQSTLIDNAGDTDGIDDSAFESMTNLDGQTGTVTASSLKVRTLDGREIRGENYSRGATVELEGTPVQIRINGTPRKFGKVASSGEPGKYVALGFLRPNNFAPVNTGVDLVEDTINRLFS